MNVQAVGRGTDESGGANEFVCSAWSEYQDPVNLSYHHLEIVYWVRFCLGQQRLAGFRTLPAKLSIPMKKPSCLGFVTDSGASGYPGLVIS
jgi:hypothetical protein